MMTNDSKDQGREAFEVLQVKGVLPLIQAMEKREREGTLPPDLQKAWNGFAIDGAPIATSASALARDEASVELTDEQRQAISLALSFLEAKNFTQARDESVSVIKALLAASSAATVSDAASVALTDDRGEQVRLMQWQGGAGLLWDVYAFGKWSKRIVSPIEWDAHTVYLDMVRAGYAEHIEVRLVSASNNACPDEPQAATTAGAQGEPYAFEIGKAGRTLELVYPTYLERYATDEERALPRVPLYTASSVSYMAANLLTARAASSATAPLTGDSEARDAARYRWARDNILPDHDLPGGFYLGDSGETWDKTIDAARAKSTNGEQS